MQGYEWGEYDRIIFKLFLAAGSYNLVYVDQLFNQSRFHEEKQRNFPSGETCFDIAVIVDGDLDHEALGSAGMMTMSSSSSAIVGIFVGAVWLLWH